MGSNNRFWKSSHGFGPGRGPNNQKGKAKQTWALVSKNGEVTGGKIDGPFKSNFTVGPDGDKETQGGSNGKTDASKSVAKDSVELVDLDKSNPSTDLAGAPEDFEGFDSANRNPPQKSNTTRDEPSVKVEDWDSTSVEGSQDRNSKAGRSEEVVDFAL